MAVYRICSSCGCEVEQYKDCKCKANDKTRYKEYKARRLQNNDERKRQEFYNDKSWIILSELIKQKYFGVCIMCWSNDKVIPNEVTHHIETLKERYDLRLVEDNLIALCNECHKNVHAIMNKSESKKRYIQIKIKKIMREFEEEFF